MSLIRIENIRKIYKMGDIEINALNPISINIEQGEFVAIMGPSGSGKSTFMNILGCLDMPTDGKYYLDSIDTTRLDKNQLASIRNLKIGFIFQGFNLIPRTSAIENVELPLIYKGVPSKERKMKTRESLNLVGLENRGHHTPNQLSGGQQQRVAIARAIANDAPIIMADEPTGNLDSKTSYEIMELFTRLNKESNKTLILVTHELDIAEYSQRIVRFKDGNLVNDEVKTKL